MNTSCIAFADRTGRDGDWEASDAGCIIDEEHLDRMTLGDRRLKCEVLQIFLRQAAIMIGRLADADPRLVAATAHTLVGSARGIGAWRVARAAERVEQASGGGGSEKLNAAIAELKAASLEASAAINARLNEKA
jgi:HPt (histidine-containing phosphotransfer) domain-containing protein